jgi:hypothetical protein
MKATRIIAIVALSLALTSCAARRPTTTELAAVAVPTSAGASTSGDAATTPGADAVTAAVRFVCSGQRLLDATPTHLPTVIRELWSARSADDAVASTVGRLVELRTRLEAGEGPTRYRQSALSVRLESGSTERATVSVWWVGVLSRNGVALPQAQWVTSKVTLVHEDYQWRVDAVTDSIGPVPDHSSDDEPITNDELERRLAGFVDWEANR